VDIRFPFLIALSILLLACGRSGLDDFLVSPSGDDASAGSGSVERDDAASGGPHDAGSDVPQFVEDAPSFADAPSKGQDAESGGPGSCGACQGCCQGTTCMGGETPDECGIFGSQCVACPAGAACHKGACFIPQPGCGPSNCPGCCLDANTCSYGTVVDECGFGGHMCQGCGAAVANPTACVPHPGGGGSCQPTCGPGNCHGCCDGNACLLGQSQNSCGAQGQACTSCVGGESCTLLGPGIGGHCQLPCSPATCAGCCVGDICAVGSQDLACGVGGKACVDCTSNHLVCMSGACQP
jgi:hypothetical protein